MDNNQSTKVLDFYTEIKFTPTLTGPTVLTPQELTSSPAAPAPLTTNIIYLGEDSGVEVSDSGTKTSFVVDEAVIVKADNVTTIPLSAAGLTLTFYYQRDNTLAVDSTVSPLVNPEFGLKFNDSETNPSHFNIMNGDKIELLVNWFKVAKSDAEYSAAEAPLVIAAAGKKFVYDQASPHLAGNGETFSVGKVDDDSVDFAVKPIEPLSIGWGTPIIQWVSLAVFAMVVNLAIASISVWKKEIDWPLKHIFILCSFLLISSSLGVWLTMNDIDFFAEPIVIALIPFVIYILIVSIIYGLKTHGTFFP